MKLRKDKPDPSLIRKKREELRRSGQVSTADTTPDSYIWNMILMQQAYASDSGSLNVDAADCSPGISHHTGLDTSAHESSHSSDSGGSSHSCGGSSSCSSASCGGGGGD